MFASLDCLLSNIPLSKSSNSLVPKSGISGTLGLNTQPKNKDTPKDTKGFPPLSTILEAAPLQPYN